MRFFIDAGAPYLMEDLFHLIALGLVRCVENHSHTGQIYQIFRYLLCSQIRPLVFFFFALPVAQLELLQQASVFFGSRSYLRKYFSSFSSIRFFACSAHNFQCSRCLEYASTNFSMTGDESSQLSTRWTD